MAKQPEPKTRPTDVDPADFLNEIKDERKRLDSFELIEMMQSVSKMPPVMWGGAIIGFGSKPIKYANGSELDWPMLAFSPRKANLTLYLQHFPEYLSLLEELGPHAVSKGCLYIKRLADVDKKILKQVIAGSFKATKNS
ncbi:MAG TPA: DUF1801 domain-containing protein [Candidatus Kapabacteria bacterium]|nr:DUF1801 domain-containing protein [Candidatus Kapabacteria bacterium]